MKKKMLVIALALMLATHLTVLGVDVNFETVIDETVGVIEDFSHGKLHISGEAITYGGLDEIVLVLGDAPIFDLLTGLPVSADCIEIGMDVRVAYLLQPDVLPQAVVIWLSPTHPDAAVFTTIVSENIQYSPDYAVFLSADAKYRITLTKETVIYCPQNGELSFVDIMPGQEFFVWVDMITASSPAQVYPDKVVLICQFR